MLQGSNLVPMNILPTNVTKETITDLVDYAVDSNMNMIRIWGGGLYPVSCLGLASGPKCAGLLYVLHGLMYLPDACMPNELTCLTHILSTGPFSVHVTYAVTAGD